jgi:rhodanese-related sulfurtransferase
LLCLTAIRLLAAEAPDGSHQVTPEVLAQQVQAGKAPLILNVGPRTLFEQAHVRGSEYVGAASSPEGIAKLRERVKALPKNAAIVLYCGCCPWEHCPNIRPAFAELEELGFTEVKALYITHNIGADWVDKGYPTEKGK